VTFGNGERACVTVKMDLSPGARRAGNVFSGGWFCLLTAEILADHGE